MGKIWHWEEARHNIGNISVPLNFIKKGYGTKVVEHNSAHCFGLLHFLVRPTGRVIGSIKSRRRGTWLAGWLAMDNCQGPRHCLPLCLPLITPEAAILFNICVDGLLNLSDVCLCLLFNASSCMKRWMLKGVNINHFILRLARRYCRVMTSVALESGEMPPGGHSTEPLVCDSFARLVSFWSRAERSVSIVSLLT